MWFQSELQSPHASKLLTDGELSGLEAVIADSFGEAGGGEEAGGEVAKLAVMSARLATTAAPGAQRPEPDAPEANQWRPGTVVHYTWAAGLAR